MIDGGRDPYDVLGISPGSDVSAIKAAYRARARELHPDTGAADASPRQQRARAAAMAELTNAYQRLNGGQAGDPQVPAAQGRVAGDMAATGSAAAGSAPVRHPVRLPWRAMLLFGVLGSIGVIALSVVNDPPPDRGPDGIITVGSCVTVLENDDVAEVPCTSENEELVVRYFVPLDGTCPPATRPHRDTRGMGIACV